MLQSNIEILVTRRPSSSSRISVRPVTRDPDPISAVETPQTNNNTNWWRVAAIVCLLLIPVSIFVSWSLGGDAGKDDALLAACRSCYLRPKEEGFTVHYFGDEVIAWPEDEEPENVNLIAVSASPPALPPPPPADHPRAGGKARFADVLWDDEESTATVNYFKFLSGSKVPYWGAIDFGYTLAVMKNGRMYPFAANTVDLPWEKKDSKSIATIPLKPGLTWHDGTPLTAHDVAFSVDLFNTYRDNFVRIDGYIDTVSFRVITNTSIEIGVPDVFDPQRWNAALNMLYIVQKNYWSNHRGSWEELSSEDAATNAPTPAMSFRYNGNGEYVAPADAAARRYNYDMVCESTGGVTTHYSEAFTALYPESNTWETSHYGGCDSGSKRFHGPFLDTYEIVRVDRANYPNPNLAVAYDDQINMVLPDVDEQVFAISIPPDAKDIESITQLKLPKPGMRYASFNMRTEPFKHKSLRQAVACIFAYEKKQLLDAHETLGTSVGWNGLEFPAWDIEPTGVLQECNNYAFAGYAEQLKDRADRIMRDNGWTKDPDDGAWVSPDGVAARGEIEILSPEWKPGVDDRALFAKRLQSAMKRLGLNAVAREKSFGELVDSVFTPEACRDWSVYLLGWNFGDYPDHFHVFFHSESDSCNGGWNTPGMSNSLLDALVSEFKECTDTDDANAAGCVTLHKQAQEILYEELPYIPMFTPVTRRLVRNMEAPKYNVFDTLKLTSAHASDSFRTLKYALSLRS